MILKSFFLGILGAVAAGLIVGVIGVAAGLSEAAVAAAATPAGMALGLLGFTLPLIRPARQRVAVRARRRTRR